MRRMQLDAVGQDGVEARLRLGHLGRIDLEDLRDETAPLVDGPPPITPP